jgi:hypothetical protein
MLPLLLPPLPPLFVRPFQLAFGIALGWMLRGRREAAATPRALR